MAQGPRGPSLQRLRVDRETPEAEDERWMSFHILFVVVNCSANLEKAPRSEQCSCVCVKRIMGRMGIFHLSGPASQALGNSPGVQEGWAGGKLTVFRFGLVEAMLDYTRRQPVPWQG